MSQDIEWLLEEKYSGEKNDAFFADCKRLALGEPLGFLIGHVPFLDTTIYLDSKPLIPRPETEYWTEAVIADIKTNYPARDLENTPGAEQLRVLDLCAGSGCIGVAIAACWSGGIPSETGTFKAGFLPGAIGKLGAGALSELLQQSLQPRHVRRQGAFKPQRLAGYRVHEPQDGGVQGLAAQANLFHCRTH